MAQNEFGWIVGLPNMGKKLGGQFHLDNKKESYLETLIGGRRGKGVKSWNRDFHSFPVEAQ